MAELNGNINIDLKVNNVGSIDKVTKYLQGPWRIGKYMAYTDEFTSYDIRWPEDFGCGEQKKYVKMPWWNCDEIKANIPTREEIENKFTLYHDVDIDTNISYIYEYVCEDGCKLRCECHMNAEDAINEVKRDRLLYKARQALVNKVLDHYRKKNEEEQSTMCNMTRNELNTLATNIRMLRGELEIEMEYGPFMSGTAKITIPKEYLKYIKVEMPTTDFSAKKFNTDLVPGLPAIKKFETYNDRVVKVTFVDGTFTKAVCSENDYFDLDVGITICCMKRMMGKDGNRLYNDLIRHAHKVMDRNEKEKQALTEEKAKKRMKDRKAELKKAARKLKAKEEQINTQAQAIVRAHHMLEDEAMTK